MSSTRFDRETFSQPPISRRDLLRAGLTAAAGMLSAGAAAGQQADGKKESGRDAPPERKITGKADAEGLRPNILLVMTDDQGWGDTGYNGHPHLKTPNLDALAAAGIRFNRFYAAAPVCSPTRGSVMTGRHPNRFGCFTHGKPIRPKEVTVADAARLAGYVTGHFGKWHLNGRSGPGKPVLADDPLNPGRMGFDRWVSVSNYYDLDPAMARNGQPEQFTGDSSDIAAAEAVKFMQQAVKDRKPFLAVVWHGSPHSPHRALDKDKALYADRPANEQNYYGELTAVDRGVGVLRAELEKLGVAANTLIWFCSDNGGAFGRTSTGGLRGSKGTLFEGGLRVPGIIVWPGRVAKPLATDVPCCTSDIYPTLLALWGVKVDRQPEPIDGISLVGLMDGKMESRPKPIGFWDHGKGHYALTDNQYKLHRITKGAKDAPQTPLYDLVKDPKETTDLSEQQPEVVAKMSAELDRWIDSVTNSLAGKDYR